MPGRTRRTSQPPRLSGLRLIDIYGVAEKFCCSRSTAFRLVKRSGFPNPTHEFGDARWVESEVDEYVSRVVSEERSVYYAGDGAAAAAEDAGA